MGVKGKNQRATEGGKGDTPRPIEGDKYRSNYDAIFDKGKKQAKPKQKPQ